MDPIYKHIYTIIEQIPKGRVATYGQIARLAGIGQPRRIGYALRILHEENSTPWHRVINAKGEISKRWEMGCEDHQKSLLEEEGVIFESNIRISLAQFQWQPRTPINSTK